jgi:hypothetical protein
LAARTAGEDDFPALAFLVGFAAPELDYHTLRHEGDIFTTDDPDKLRAAEGDDEADDREDRASFREVYRTLNGSARSCRIDPVLAFDK